MASASHEIPTFLFRERPEALVHLLEIVLNLKLPPYQRIQIAEADFTQLVPTEYRADLVMILDGDSGPAGAVVVEPQLARDDGKRYSWPLYTAALHAKVRCPTWLVVLAGSSAVARWARRAIETFQPRSHFAPLVIARSDVPRITSETEATRWPELAVLAARAHGNSLPDGQNVRRGCGYCLHRARRDRA